MLIAPRLYDASMVWQLVIDEINLTGKHKSFTTWNIETIEIGFANVIDGSLL